MQVKTFASIIALGTALALAAPAAAQTQFNGTALSADDLPKVQARCDELANTASTESLAEDNEGGDDDGDRTNDETDDNSDAGGAPQANAAANATSAIDLDTVTLEMCTEAGLSTSP